MKKALSLVSSAVLALAVAIPAPAFSQPAAKKLAARSGASAIELKAVPQKTAQRGVHVPEKRLRSFGGDAPSLRRAMKLTHRNATVASTRKSPLAAAADLPLLVGMVTYRDTWTKYDNALGLYTIKGNGANELHCLGPTGMTGMVSDGIYYTSDYESFWGMLFVNIYGYDVETGQEVCSYYGDTDDIFFDLATDPVTGKIYGIGYNADGDGVQLSEVKFSTSAVVTTAIAPLDGNWNSIACDAAGQLYGISYTGETVDDDFVVSASLLNKIDKTSGAVTAVGTTGQLPKYLSSAAIDPVSGRMFWTVSDSDGSGRLCEVNLSTGLATVLTEFTENDEVQGMYVPYGENAADTPARTNATLRYEDGKMKLSWTPVTSTIYGAPLDGAVTYSVTRYPGAVKVAAKTAATSFEEAISAGASLEQYYYTVATHAGDATSGEAKSNVITLGSVTPPYMNDFSAAEALDGYTLIDANKDSKTWIIADGRARMDYNSSIDMDDWLVTPPLALEAGKLYLVSFKASGNGTSFTERIEVKYGTEATPAGLSNTLIPVTELRSAQDQEFSQYLVPEADGNYYIGFHGCSVADQYYLFIDDISIAAGLESTAPGLATDIRIVPDPDGAYKATVSFKAPAKDLADAPLSSIEKIVVARDGDPVKTFNAPAPGAGLDFVDETDQSGSVSYSIVAYNASGAGAAATATAFIGIDKPAAPENIKVTEGSVPGMVTVSWDPVTKDHNGNPINPDLVQYIVAKYDSSAGGWVEVHDDLLTETAYTFRAVPEGKQDFMQFAVFAGTDGGENGAAYDGMIAIGTPYAGITESFADSSLAYIWAVGYAEAEGSWSIHDDDAFSDLTSADGDNGFAAMNGRYLDSTAALYSGKISLAGAKNPGISFSTYVLAEDDINEIQLYVKEPADADWTALGEPVVVKDLSEETGWASAIASLADYAGKIIQVRFQATTKAYAYTMLDKIKIGDLLSHDLCARSISAPEKVDAGAGYNVDVTVSNEGMQSAGAFSVELYADGSLADTKSFSELASGSAVTARFDMNMSAIADSPVEIYAKVVYTADENPADNTSETVSVAPKHSRLPAVTDLSAKHTAEGNALAWSEPDLTNASADEGEIDFEDGTAWAKEYGDWTFIDKDNSPVGGFQDSDIPGIDPGTTAASFFVFDSSDASVTGDYADSFKAHSGDKYLASLFRYDDGTVDDWAISPALDGSAQTITFWARSYSSQYPESIEMYYSTGSLATDDFKKVGNIVSPVPGEWTEYSFSVPAGAKHFAIRSCATGSFMLMLDDFTFAPAGGSSADLSIVGYDIYRDGEKITAEPVGETEFTDTEASDADHTYVVVTVYTEGISAPSNAVTVSSSGIDDALAGAVTIKAGNGHISITGAEGKHVSIAALDGKLIYSARGQAAHNVGVADGIYIVKAGSTIAKVAVK